MTVLRNFYQYLVFCLCFQQLGLPSVVSTRIRWLIHSAGFSAGQPGVMDFTGAASNL